MDEIKAKQQVVERIKESAKILVTVSSSPSVDALSAALALTMILDKQEKYATAIFSGETPPAIAFLEPEKTFDDTTDSLRDFIIALNKEKADHLRYKVEGDSVKIFITPYKTTIDQSDLEFSQGDYNVELVIALGVDKQENLDKALEDHGQILHDAAIITMTAGDQTSDLGGVDWHDSNSSSLSEMVAGLAEALKEDKKKSLLDEAIATALLTGIVAETDRFSNEHTTSKVMTVAATLMSAGADQQLIATELQASHEIEAPVEEETPEESDVEVDKESNDGSLTIKKNHDPSSLEISHEGETLAELDRRVMGEEKAKEKVAEEVEAAQTEAAREEALQEAHEQIAEASEETSDDTPEAPAEEAPLIGPAVVESSDAGLPASAAPAVGSAYAAEDEVEEPTLGGTLNATTEQAAEDARREAENDQNRTILSHAYLGSNDTPVAPAAEGDSGLLGAAPTTPGSVGVNDFAAPGGEEVHSAYALDDEPAAPTAAEPVQPMASLGSERVIQPLSDALASSVAAATVPPEAAPAAPTLEPAPILEPAPTPEPTPAPVAESYAPPVPNPTPTDLGLPLPPPIPDFSQVNGAAPALPLPPTPTPEILGDILAPEPAPVDVSNAIPAPNTAYAPEPAPVLPPIEPTQPPAPVQPQPQPQPAATDPGQFQIPTQPQV